jgi:hypothetical protein
MTPRQDPCQESSSVRQVRTAVIRRTPSPLSSYSQPNTSQSSPTGGCFAKANSLMRHRVRFRPCIYGMFCGYNPPIRPNGEKTVSAGSAPVSGETKQTEQPCERTGTVLAGNALQVHVPAHPAMHETNVRDWRGPGIKSQVATPAAPGAQQSDPHDIVLHTPPAGTAGAVALTRRAKQSDDSPGKNSKQQYVKAVSQGKVRVTC